MNQENPEPSVERKREMNNAPKVEANPELDKYVNEINECIAGMIGYGMDDEPGEPNYRRMAARKQELEDAHGKELLPYLQPYVGIDLKSHSVPDIEWARFRVARNWGRYEGNK